MSATSTAGRDNGRALSGHLQQEVERARHLADRADGDTGVERGRVELLVPEQDLDDPDIGLLFQQMGGKAVPQRMNPTRLVMPARAAAKQTSRCSWRGLMCCPR